MAMPLGEVPVGAQGLVTVAAAAPRSTWATVIAAIMTTASTMSTRPFTPGRPGQYGTACGRGPDCVSTGRDGAARRRPRRGRARRTAWER